MYRINNPPNPSRILNTSLPVGRVEGAACVSPIGAATYQIPVKVPGGTGGMQPQISAGYNSQGGNGLMGWGWNLSATSVIARVGKNCYYDGITGEVKLDTSDNLMLDGKRLMRTSGNNLAIGSVYAAEVEDHSIVEYMTINARDTFQVRTADGLVYEYGTADDSYIHAQNSGVALFWLLSKVTDRFGNYMLYHYEKGMLPGEFYLSSIEYTGNTKANVSPYNRIEFAYRLRKDGIDAYTAGNVIRQRYLLTGIKCISNGAAVKEYRFKYIFDRYYSKLSEVEEYGLNGARYNSTIIDWGDYAGMYSKYAYERMALLSADREGLYPDFEDFNGDGMADMMTYPTQSSYSSSNNTVLYTGISLYGNDISYKKQCSIPLIQNFVRLMYADLNGDGKLDVIRVHQADAGNYRFEYYMFDGKAFKSAGGFNSSDFKAMAGDFNGDGKMELLTRDSKLYNEKAEVIASGGIDNWGEEYRYSYPNNNYIVDFNGDGQSDLLTMDYTGSWVYTLSGSGFIQLTSYRNTWLTCAQLNYFGDFNGDGKTDVLCRPRYDTHKLSLYLSTGRSFQTREIGNNGIESKILVGDTNLDGQDEIIHMNPAMGNIKLKVKVGTFNGSNFDHETYVSSMVNYSQINDDVANNRANVAVKDLDGDGRVELVLAAYADQNLIYAFDDKQNLKVKKIEDGYNNLVDFQYESLPSSAFYTEGSQSFAFPLAKMKVPLYVVTHKTTHVNGYSQSLTYAYKGLYVHRQGKGLLGFDSIEETYYDKQTKTIANYGYSRGGYIPYLSGLEVRSTNGTSMHETTCYSNVISKGNKRYEWQPSEIMEEDFLRGTLVSRYDNDYLYGRPQLVAKITGENAEVQQTTYTNVATSDLRLLGLPATILTAKGKIGDSSPWTEQTDITYDSNYNIVKKVTGVDDTNKISEESYTYDTFGNILTKSVKLYDSTTPLTASYKYSRNGNLLLETTDTYGRKTAYSYDAQGRLVAKNNHKNQVTRYEYDDMGNLIKTTHPDNVVETTSVAWNQSAPQSLYAVTRTSTLAPTTITYYSAFGKEVRKGMMQFDGKMTFTDTSYDQNGVLKKVSLPFTGASATLWNTYTYDEYGRPVSILYASGKEDKWSYYANSVTETRDGVSVTRTADATGKLTNVGSLSGSISYDYILGDRINSIVSNGIRTSFVYDSFGRQTGINDPSAGISTFGYDKYGNKATQTDARGETVSQAFDPYGKVLERVTPEGTFTYTYNADHLLATVTGSNGTGFAYTYDAFGNVLTEKETGANDKWLQKSYSYINGARIATAYQSDSGMIATESYTYANGYLKTVTAGNDIIWELQEVDAFGHATKVKTGDITRIYTYYAYGYPTGRTATSAAGGVFLNSASVFDPIKGNLTSRTDVTRNLTENFEYDPLNTLTIYKDCGEIYDDFGKLWLKGDAGLYNEYDNYQVKCVNLLEDLLSPPSVIAHRNQDIAYTSFMRPDSITENGYQATFVYNGDNRRVKMQLKKDGNEQLTRHYLGNVYEVDETVDSVKEKLYLGGDYYNAYAVYMKQNGVWTMNYICRDYLGSITHITDAAGSLLAEYSYDAWGRQRNPATMEVYAPDTEPELLLGRGYTGHEHLPFFGLINMNARLYDPVLGLFLSPDPYVQLPDNPMSYNRYAYAMNNPMRYTDPNGEFLLGLICGFIRGLVTDENPFKTAWQGAVNEVKILAGLFTTDSRKGTWGQVWEMVSRFTWQAPQTILGVGFTTVSNWAGQVDEVDYWGGATVSSGNNWNSGAVTLGSYITGNRNLKADPDNYLFQHEYGHYLQSQEMGWGYLSTVGLPSLTSAAGSDEHSLEKFEQDANRRAFNYFNKNVPGFYTSPSAYESQKKSEAYVNNTATGWNFYSNPLDINNIGVDSKRHYYDYNASGAINSPNMTLRMFWLKY